MKLNRREWLRVTALGTSAPFVRLGPAFARAQSAESFGAASRVISQEAIRSPVERRISDLVREYEAQGYHRTGTAVDQASGNWLSDQVRQAGLVPTQEAFSLDRVDPISSVLIAGDRRIEGLPLFDGGFTSPAGVRGRLSALESNLSAVALAKADAEIGLTRTAVNATARDLLGDARRTNRHKAIVAVTAGRRPGLCPSNADSFLRPFGPPVLQVSSDEAAWLGEQAQRSGEVQLIAHVTRTRATANNITASIEGTAPELPLFVIMTPRSGWYWCASERGGGIACWLELMRAFQTARAKRTILFVASSGHELGHLGIDAFIDRRPGVVAKAAGWMHFGANIGAATDSRITLQASDDELDAVLTRALTASGLSVSRRNPRGTIPGGEAEAVHRGGGRYVSIIGGSELFHHPDDRGPKAIDPSAIARFSTAFIEVARTLANSA